MRVVKCKVTEEIYDVRISLHMMRYFVKLQNFPVGHDWHESKQFLPKIQGK